MIAALQFSEHDLERVGIRERIVGGDRNPFRVVLLEPPPQTDIAAGPKPDWPVMMSSASPTSEGSAASVSGAEPLSTTMIEVGVVWSEGLDRAADRIGSITVNDHDGDDGIGVHGRRHPDLLRQYSQPRFATDRSGTEGRIAGS